MEKHIKEYPIGAVFKHCDGKYYRVMNDKDKGYDNICEKYCWIARTVNCTTIMRCLSEDRIDRESVHYEQISKREAMEHLLTGE